MPRGIYKHKLHSEETKKKLSENLKKQWQEGIRKKSVNFKHTKPHTEESKQKMSLAKKGKRLSEEHRRKIGLKLKGRPAHPWTEESRIKLSLAHKGEHHSPNTEFKKGHKSNLGKKFSEEARKNISLAHKGQITWNKGLKGKELLKHYKSNNSFKGMLGKHHTEEYKRKMSEILKGKTGHPWTEESRIKISLANKGKHNSPKTEFKKGDIRIKAYLKRRTPSNLEQKMIGIIEKLNLPYKFVGDGQFWLGGKNPDFINCNGEKTAIEVFYRKHKEVFKGNIESWKNGRSEIFNRYGWKIIFLDETQVNEDFINKTIGGNKL